MLTIVADSSPLIGLAGIGHLDLLPALFSRILVPPAVWEEVAQIRPEAPGANLLRQQTWLQVEEIGGPGAVPLLTQLGKGEAEAIALARMVKGELLMDDLRARKWAKQLQVPHFGTLALLGRAKRAGLIKEIHPLTKKLKANGIFIGRSLLRAVLVEVGEQSGDLAE